MSTTKQRIAARRAQLNQATIERAVLGGVRLLRTGLGGPHAPSSLDRR